MERVFIHTATGAYPKYENDIRAEQPLSLFPVPFEPGEHYEEVALSEPPEHDAATHKVVQIEPVEIDGVLTQQWEVVSLNADDLAQIEAQRQADATAAADAARITITKRQALLALFDLRGIKDTDIDAQIELIEDETQRYRARVDWQGAASIESDSPTVLMLAASLDLPESDLRALFEYARAV